MWDCDDTDHVRSAAVHQNRTAFPSMTSNRAARREEILRSKDPRSAARARACCRTKASPGRSLEATQKAPQQAVHADDLRRSPQFRSCLCHAAKQGRCRHQRGTRQLRGRRQLAPVVAAEPWLVDDQYCAVTEQRWRQRAGAVRRTPDPWPSEMPARRAIPRGDHIRP